MSVFVSLLFNQLVLNLIDNVYTLSYYFHEKEVRWDKTKNLWLLKNRGISFKEIRKALANRPISRVIGHYNQQKYSHQKILIIEINQVIYTVPFVSNTKETFLKTIFRNRKYK